MIFALMLVLVLCIYFISSYLDKQKELNQDQERFKNHPSYYK